MSSTSVNIGISSDAKISSRVLKPPGGGHTDIFAPAEEAVLKPRPKHNQQNSAMMGEIMGKACDSNGTKQNGASNDASPSGDASVCVPAPKPAAVEAPKPSEPAARIRVPPGGFSSGLW